MLFVSFKECFGYEGKKLHSALEAVLEPLGGMQAFVKPGAKVLVKPNLLAAAPVHKAVTTHPSFIAAVVDLILPCKPELVHIRDNPAIEDPEDISKVQGLECFHNEAKTLAFSDYRAIENKAGGIIKSFKYAHEVFDYDVVINLPKLKTHCQMTMTLAVKNCFGLVEHGERVKLHLRGGFNYDMFADLLLDICLTRPPELNIIDGILGMEGKGPGSGDLIALNMIAASASPFALDDALVTALGHSPEIVPVTKQAKQRNLTPEYKIVGDDIQRAPIVLPELFCVNFIDAMPGFMQKFFKNLILAKPKLVESNCIHCKKCLDICPPKAISWAANEIPEVDYETCIRCYCCIEVCPEKALEPYENWLGRAFKLVSPIFKKALQNFVSFKNRVYCWFKG